LIARSANSTVEPILLKGGGTVKSLSAAFLADLEQDWLAHGKEIFPVLREKYPQAYFQGIVSLARIIRWEVGPAGRFDRPRTPEEIMDKLEKSVGPEGRKLFEQFIVKLHRLEQQQASGVAGGDAIERALAVAAATNARPR
jgi:hypothetical protein